MVLPKQEADFEKAVLDELGNSIGSICDAKGSLLALSGSGARILQDPLVGSAGVCNKQLLNWHINRWHALLLNLITSVSP